MGRVSPESINKLRAFFDSLPEEAQGKCALCNETLTHIVKMAEAETGCGTATVTRELSNRINEGAARGDKVSGKQLQDRTRYYEGKDKIGNSENNQPPRQEPAPLKEQYQDYLDRHNGEPEARDPTENLGTVVENGEEFSIVPPEAYQFAMIAIAQLERIGKNDPDKRGAFMKVFNWMNSHINGGLFNE